MDSAATFTNNSGISGKNIRLNKAVIKNIGTPLFCYITPCKTRNKKVCMNIYIYIHYV